MNNQDRRQMEAALKAVVIPVLRSSGFKGSFPHFRRVQEIKAELLTFQFDRNGGGFVIEISACSKDGITTSWGEFIPALKVTAHDLHPDKRLRLQNPPGPDESAWYRYDTTAIDAIVSKILSALPYAEIWWAGRTV